MSKWGKCDFRQLEAMQKKLENMEKKSDEFCRKCAQELALRLLALVKDRTPTGDHPSAVEFIAKIPAKHVEFTTKEGKQVSFDTKPKTKQVKFDQHSGVSGGTLKHGWSCGTIQQVGDSYVIEVINPTFYASYVEYGHRTANHKDWVEGKFMLTKSARDLERAAPGILERKLQKFLKECLNAE